MDVCKKAWEEQRAQINPFPYDPLIFNRGNKHTQWAKDSLFNEWYQENWTDTCRTKKLDHLLTSHTRINSKWIKDLTVRLKTIKVLEENIGSKISGISHSNFLSDISIQARETKEKINKWDYIKLKRFCTAKEIIKKIKRQPTEWDNIFTDTSNKRLISKFIKYLQNMPKPQTTQLKNEQRT